MLGILRGGVAKNGEGGMYLIPKVIPIFGIIILKNSADFLD